MSLDQQADLFNPPTVYGLKSRHTSLGPGPNSCAGRHAHGTNDWYQSYAVTATLGAFVAS